MAQVVHFRVVRLAAGPLLGASTAAARVGRVFLETALAAEPEALLEST